jgi:hypothetical protein
MGGASAVVKKAKKVAKKTVEKVASDPRELASFGLTGGLSSVKTAQKASGEVATEEAEAQEKQRAEAARQAAEQQQRTGTSAIASAEDISRGLAADPSKAISGSVAAGDPRSGLFKGLVQNIEQRRAQILQSRRAGGRRSTILTR